MPEFPLKPRGTRITRPLVLAACVGGILVCGLTAPTVTRQGVNFQVSRYEIPLYVKAVDFFHRHYQYRLLAKEITRGLRSDHDRVMAVFDWTRQHIRRTPADWPIVDDHVLNIIIRGYGLEDQMADVFTTLLTYAGVPAFWRSLRISEGTKWLIFSFARIDGRWVMCDVGNDVRFTDAAGRWLDVTELLEQPELPASLAGLTTRQGVVYQPYLERLRPFRVPATLRAQKQMPFPRMWYEICRALHAIPDTDEPRPDMPLKVSLRSAS